MIQLVRQPDLTLLELGPTYATLDKETVLEEFGGMLLTVSLTADPPIVLLDLSATGYIGTSFVELLVRAWKRLTERGGTLALCNVQPFCAEVFRITRLDTLWDIYPTRGQAIVALTGRSE
ncbi:MAG: STAS domain-containing protein [Candidatus Nealsonbacteria bacterium]|nr:STAS domain-containing protein [Candidatus Nealsonbacteria bacterium]